MNVLIESYHRLLAHQADVYQRRCYQEFSLDHRFIGLIGARGVGKTTFLLNHLASHHSGSNQALYVSADNIYFSATSLFELAENFYKEFDGKLLCIDEVHRYPNWNQELKNIYDSFPSMSVIFTGSSSIDLVKGQYDLSRRALLYYMQGFSFREYLEVKTSASYPVLRLQELTETSQEASQLLSTTKLVGFFKEYLKTGYYPMFLELGSENACYQALSNVVDKTIYEDISSFYALKTKNIPAFRQILAFLATSKPGEFSINQLANSLKKDHSTVTEYLEMLRESGLLRFLLKDKSGHALIRKAEKIFFENPNLLYSLSFALGKVPEIGTVRENFAIEALGTSNYKVFYSDVGDINCEGLVFEIGEKSKTKKQIKGVKNAYCLLDDTLVLSKGRIPLLLLGFLR